MVEILEDLRVHQVLECKFERRMREVHTALNWNPRGILSPYETESDYNHFAVGEAGVIQSGGTAEYQILKQTMRALWKSVNITGELQRLRSEQFIGVKEEYGQEIDDTMAMGLAANRAIETILKRASQIYKRLKNFYAINGVDSSAIGTVTGVPAGTTVPFAWTTDHGNRMLYKGMKLQFYDTSATTLRRLHAHYAAARNETEAYSQVSATVDHRYSVNAANNGAVTFDVLPSTALAAGDTVHALQGYGALPQGFFHWVGDTGNLNGATGSIARSVCPEVFCSVIQDNSASTANTPALMLAMESMFRGKISENEPIAMEIWMNKAQVYRYQLFGMNSSVAGGAAFNVSRFGDWMPPTQMDVGIPHKGLSFNNIRIEEDRDVPPSKIMWIDWLAWQIDQQTPDTIYEYHQNQQMFQGHSQYGEPVDAKQITMFSQYNYRCTKFKTNGYQEDLAYDGAQVGQP
jgi:hypothetical protein